MAETKTIEEVSNLASDTARSAWALANDFLIILVVLAVFLVFAWRVGRGHLVSVILSFYGAYAVYSLFPYTALLPSSPPLTALLAQVGVYAVLSFIFYIILQRLIVDDFLYVGILGLIILSLLATSFLVALAYHAFPVTAVYSFTPAIDALFYDRQLFFWWFVAPLIGLLIFAK